MARMSKIWADTKEQRKLEPVRPHKEFFDYINERHAIFLKRRAGKPWPWTDDPILQEWSFTNVWRQLDKTTVWLTDNIFRPHYADKDQATLLFNIVLHREFNLISTSYWIGYVKRWEPAKITAALRERTAKGDKVFTSAHLVRSEDWKKKTDSVVEILTPVWESRKQLLYEFRTHRSIEAAWRRVHDFRFLGAFMGYQFVLDWMDSPILSDARDRLTWAATGPGALKGLKWLYPVATYSTSLTQMFELLEEGKSGALGKHVLKFELPFTVHEIEMNLCELSKYLRTKLGYGTPRNKFRYVGR